MKKTNRLLAICVIGGIVVSTIALRKIYSYSPKSLLENFLCSVFTGCLFAVPSGLLVIIKDIKQNQDEQAAILCELDVYFASITKKEFEDCCFESIEKKRFNIAGLYRLLRKELDENHINKKERAKIEELCNKIFVFSSIVVDLIKKHESISKKNFDDDVKHICELSKSCISIIRAIQENAFDEAENEAD